MAKNQRLLTYYDRQMIEYWLRLGKKSPKIAEKIKKDRTVVWREIQRNSGEYLDYSANRAQEYAERRGRKTNVRKLVKDKKLHNHVVKKLNEGWSPEQISGRLKEHPLKSLVGKSVNHETIYQFIYEVEPWLFHQLHQKRPNRRQHFSRRHYKPVIPNRTSIHERPEYINSREEIGHFESDSIVGKHRKQGLSVQYERSIQYIKFHRIINFTAKETMEAIQTTIETLPIGFIKSMTFDNGGENTNHEQLNLPTYFCDPYKAWQKGGVENANKLIRRYLPKGTDFREITDEKLKEIEIKLNNRPRKKLNYQTPEELLTTYKMLH